MTNTAKEIILPHDATIFRTIFLYVGQGDATLMVVPDGGGQRYILMDSNVDAATGGIDLAELLGDLLDEGETLDVFINTHPHTDHVRGIKAIHEKVTIGEVLHSAHVPSKNHEDAYKELKEVMDAVGSDNVYELRGTRSENMLDRGEKSIEHKIGDVNYNVLSPAQHVKDDVEGEDAETRYSRIHEQCGVIRFTYGSTVVGILHTGDSDRKAWDDNGLTRYHQDRLPSAVIGASHHGSRTFFKYEEADDTPYTEHIKTISPEYLIISSPKQSESKHDHPHDDALELYGEFVDKANILHLGKNRECVIVDISPDGGVDVTTDRKLVETYGRNPNGDDKSGGRNASESYAGIPLTRLDDKPMGGR
jgi:beta-lactamase superfamily II metal-dependent hydrolase